MQTNEKRALLCCVCVTPTSLAAAALHAKAVENVRQPCACSADCSTSYVVF